MSEGLALLFGAAIVAFFSYERFNRATYEAGSRLERLVLLVSPNKLRARRIVLQAWMSYAGMLLIIYLIFCAYAEVIPGIATGSDAVTSPGAVSSDSETGGLGIPAAVSLSVALAIVGLAPSFPLLQRVDDSMLMTAHRFAGIPTRVLNDTDDLRLNAIDLGRSPSDDLNIPSGYWDRMTRYSQVAREYVSAPDDFIDDVNLIFAVASWIFERRLRMENPEFRDQFEALEEDLAKRFEFLKMELDERTGFVLGAQRALPRVDNPDTAEADGEEFQESELKRRTWDRIASDIDALADDTCILLSLYVEHGLIKEVRAKKPPKAASGTSQTSAVSVDGSDASEPAEISVRQKNAARQQDLASARLRSFLRPVLSDEHRDRQPSNSVPAMLWSLGLILTVTLVWSMTLGVYETGLSWEGDAGSFYGRTAGYLAVAINCFIVPIAVALAVRNGMSRSNRWTNLSDAHWTVYVPQSAFIVVASWSIAIFLVIAFTLWQVGLSEAGGFSNNQSFKALRGAFEFNALAVLRGSVLGLVCIWLLDAHVNQARVTAPNGLPVWSIERSLKWAIIAAFVMALIGFFSRWIQSQVSLKHSTTRFELDEIDHGLIFYATFYCTVIGFLVVLVVSEVVARRWRLNARKKTGGRTPIRTPAE